MLRRKVILLATVNPVIPITVLIRANHVSVSKLEPFFAVYCMHERPPSLHKTPYVHGPQIKGLLIPLPLPTLAKLNYNIAVCVSHTHRIAHCAVFL